MYYLDVLRNYATFSGRARRSEYWYFVLTNTFVSFGLRLIDNFVIGSPSDPGFIGSLYSIAVLVPSIAVGVRRMHDVGKSGWFLLIPIYNIILLFTEGDKGTNDYGPDPKNPDKDLDAVINQIGREEA